MDKLVLIEHLRHESCRQAADPNVAIHNPNHIFALFVCLTHVTDLWIRSQIRRLLNEELSITLGKVLEDFSDRRNCFIVRT